MHLLVTPSGRSRRTTVVSRTPGISSESGTAVPASRKRLVPRWLGEVGLVAGLYFLYELVRGFQSTNLGGAEQTGWALLHWEQRWHLAVEASLNAGLKDVPVLAVVCSYYYATLHFIVTPLVLIYLYRRHPTGYGPARTALILATSAALIGYFLLPTAPPRMLAGSAFTDTLSSVSKWGWWGNEASAPRGFGALTNQLAAMPSMHVGWALWSGWCLWRFARSRAVRVLGIAYPVATTLVVMSTANHYLVDGLAGSALVALAGSAVWGYGVLRRRKPGDSVEAVSQVPAERIPEQGQAVPLDDRLPDCGRTSGPSSDRPLCHSR